MCLYPKLILNKKYVPTKKNNYNPPPLTDERLKYVAVGCGECIQCRKQKAREWQIRLAEELKTSKGTFVTLTFTEESIENIGKQVNTDDANSIATYAVRHFLERYRKKYKKSVKHWLITEIGHINTERLHLHGIIFKDIQNDELTDLWKYGRTDTGTYCTERTVNYIIKYVTKIDTEHREYKPIILCSKGLGKGYIDIYSKSLHTYSPGHTIEYYKNRKGYKMNLPIYYRNKLFTEKEREELWIDRLNTETRYVNGIKIENCNNAEAEDRIFTILKTAQAENEKMGYGSDKTFKAKRYRAKLDNMKKFRNKFGNTEKK